MVDYDDGSGHIMDVVQEDESSNLLKQPMYVHCPLEETDPQQQQPELHLVWSCNAGPYTIDQGINGQAVGTPLDILPPDVDLQTADFVYEVEEAPQEEEVFEEITKARCIECDKMVDMSQPPELRKHSCELVKKHPCDQCGTRFNSAPNLAVHRVLHHFQQNNFIAGTECELCDSKTKKKFQRYNAYVAHMKTHVRSETFVCASCGQEFDFVCLYNRHRRITHGIGEFIGRRGYSGELGYCNKCDKLLELTKVDAHRLTHAVHQKMDRKARGKEKVVEMEPMMTPNGKKKNYICDQCGKAFVRPSELKRHSAVHEEGAKFKCMACDKTFSHQAGLNAHIKLAHSTQKPKFNCTICGAVFAKKSNLERHVKCVHPLSTQKQMFDCSHCTCQFKSLGALNKHLRLVHNEVKQNFSCQPCGKDFTLMSSLRSHEMTQHVEPPAYPFGCFKCNKRFKLRSSLKLHLDVHQRKEIDDPVLTDPKCPICLKHLSSKNNLRRHILTHQNHYECPDCCQKFSSIHRLDRHRCFRAMPPSFTEQDMEVDVNSRPAALPSKAYYCKQCPSSFYSFKAYKEHKALHSGHRPHLCWTCHKSFRTADLLQLHKVVHNREELACMYCPMVMNSRVQYNAHLRAVHYGLWKPSSGVHLQNDRTVEISSSQSFPIVEQDDREEMGTGFPTRAQSADLDGREGGVMDSWHPMATVETVPDRSLRCPLCCHLFNSIAQLIQHFINTENDRDHSFAVLRCPLCDISLRGSGEAAAHFNIEHIYVEDPNAPQVPVFVAPEAVDYVESRATKSFPCTMCSSVFQKPSDLRRHIRTHTGERPYQCDVCLRSFSLRSSLNSHMKTHNRGEPEQLCAVCGSLFYTKNALILHMRLHSGEKPLRCRFCPESFRTSSARKQHEKGMHGASVGQCKGRCRNRGCVNCGSAKRPRMMVQENQQIEAIFQPMPSEIVVTNTFDPTMATVLDQGYIPPDQLPFPKMQFTPISVPKDPETLMMDTVAEITKMDALPLETAKCSAFEKTAPNRSSIDLQTFIHITARRITQREYTVTIARVAPKAIREGVDTTASVQLTTLRGLAEQDTPLRLPLTNDLQLNVLPKGVLEFLGQQQSVVLRAHPMNPENMSCVALITLSETTFFNRCEICEVDLPTKEMSDEHFASADHEAAQVCHPLTDAVQDRIHDNDLMSSETVAQPRRDEVTCKLCGSKFLHTEVLVTHIRLEHERDHPHSLAPRPVARTAPPLEVTRDRF